MTDNKIFVEGGDFSNGNISGVCSLSGNNVDVSNNIVEINAGNDTRSDVGGHTRNGTAFRNSVFGGLVVGNGNANNNKVIINDKRIKGHVFGGCIFGNGNANNNEVTI
ncbi:hypothetical protein AGMMS49950_10580 [Endomicrobiia bacterium]|nr:hypothetical protein AGMMS49950_10580 [Endomicrobiia bacterium]